MNIPFNKPYSTGKEFKFIKQAHQNNHLSGDGMFTKKCQKWLETNIGCHKSFLTHSGTAALEIAALLIDLQPGDEIIMPSFTFVSTANAFVLRGATPVFVDIRPDTFNIDESKIGAAITKKTKAIVVVHYAGVGCEMDTILSIARKYNLYVIEDAAHAILAKYKNHSLGSMGHFAALSFHETKNIISGEGGALLMNDDRFTKRAEIIREKGTNRSSFFRNEISKYTWVDIGSSYLPSELIAAFLWAQMEEAYSIMESRKLIWENYRKRLLPLEHEKKLTNPFISPFCSNNFHMYSLLLPTTEDRDNLLKYLKAKEIDAVFHYIPLHASLMGRKVSRHVGNLEVTQSVSSKILRLPFWIGMTLEQIDYICDQIKDFFHHQSEKTNTLKFNYKHDEFIYINSIQ